MKEYFQLSSLSNGELPIRPIRNKINTVDKTITDIVLEDGTMIPLNNPIPILEKSQYTKQYMLCATRY